MNIVPMQVELVGITPDAMKLIERIGRVVHKSEDRITEDSAEPFVRMLVRLGHGSVIEHAYATLRFVVDRGVTHEQVRHRLCSYTQESTRYCNYSKSGRGISVVQPLGIAQDSPGYAVWEGLVLHCDEAYHELLRLGYKPQVARAVLPISLKTEIYHTANFWEWRHIFRLRTAPDAHAHIRWAMNRALDLLREQVPVLFEDIKQAE